MAPNHLIREVLISAYEGGEDWSEICSSLGLNSGYTRDKARLLITDYINKFIPIKENEHPLMNAPFLLLRQLVDYLQQDSKGIKVIIYNELPSVY